MRTSKTGLINDVLSKCSHTRRLWVPTGFNDGRDNPGVLHFPDRVRALIHDGAR